MGCEIYAGSFSINTTRAAWMVAQMCSKWFDPERDTDSDGTYQDSVSNESIKAADSEWPNDVKNVYTKFLLEHFDVYRLARSKVPVANHAGFEDDFKNDLKTAREFIANVAMTDERADLSH